MGASRPPCSGLPKTSDTGDRDANAILGPLFGVRHVQAILLFFCFMVNFVERLVVSVALVAMTNAETTNPDFPEYNWSTKQMSYIISGGFVGLIIGLVPGSYMCRRFGVKLTMFMSLLGSSLFGIITPICIPFGGWSIYLGLRIMQGIFQSFFFPSVLDHLAKWSPIEERTLLGASSHTGAPIGTILAISSSGFIAKSSLGWPGISYVANGFGIVVCVFWLILADNSPMTSRFISDTEKNYILASQATVESNHKRIPIPWKEIFTSRPYLSLIIVQGAENWGHTTIVGQIPLYMRGVLKMDISQNAVFSALPYVAMFVMAFVYLIVADVIIKKKFLSLTVLRKVCNSMAMWIPAATLIGVGFLDENQKSLAIALLVVTVGINAGVTIGQTLNTIDLSPNHTSTLVAISFAISSTVSVITPLYVGVIVTDQTDRVHWQIVFLTAAVVYFLGNLQYLFFGSTQTQPWNDEHFVSKKNEKKVKEMSCE